MVLSTSKNAATDEEIHRWSVRIMKSTLDDWASILPDIRLIDKIFTLLL
jgi:hypothetical protein